MVRVTRCYLYIVKKIQGVDYFTPGLLLPLPYMIDQARANYVSRVNPGSSAIFSDSPPVQAESLIDSPASQNKNICFLRHTFVEKIARMV